MTLEIEIDYWRLTFDLYIDVEKLVCGWCTLDYNISSGPFLSYEIEIGDGPGPELDNNAKNRENIGIYKHLLIVNALFVRIIFFRMLKGTKPYIFHDVH